MVNKDVSSFSSHHCNTISIHEIEVYIQALEDSMKMLPKDENEVETVHLRPGSMLSRARDALERAGHPMHIDEILQAVGRPVNKKNRLSLGGSISNYYRKGLIFTRAEPNTFGLLKFEKSSNSAEGKIDKTEDEVPF